MSTGPFGTEREARAAADHAGLTGTITTRNRDMLARACWAAHVELGAFDRRILDWLAGYEPSTVAVVAGWISRAFEAGRASARAPGLVLSAAQLDDLHDALADASAYRRGLSLPDCADCDKAPGGVCADHQADAATAQAYEDLSDVLHAGGEVPS